ncbi:hypothetical protein [Coleofasciculus sp. FACHB-125]
MLSQLVVRSRFLPQWLATADDLLVCTSISSIFRFVKLVAEPY